MRGCLTCGENPLSLVVVNWPHEWTLSCPQMISAILSGSPSVYAKCKIQNHLYWLQVKGADKRVSHHMQKRDPITAH